MKPVAITAGLAVAAAALYVARLDRAAGLYVDDAWYIVLAQAVSQGEGFRLVSSAATPILPAFPPGFAVLLAPVVAVLPPFPGNVIGLKAVSIVAMLGVGLAGYVYLRRAYETPPPVAAAVALGTVLMPAFVFLATSTIMAEAVFTLGQLVMAILVDRAARATPQPGRWGGIVAGGLLAGATLLVRLAGLAGVAAGALYLWRRRGWRAALLFASVTAICYLPWAAYATANRATPAERAAHGGSIAYGYDELLLMRRGGEVSSGRITLEEWPGRVWANVVNVFGRDLGAQVFPSAYRGPAESGQEVFMLTGDSGLRAGSMGSSPAVVWVSSAISLVVTAGFFAVGRRRFTVAEYLVPLTIAMVLLVPARTYRYVLPLAPFLLWYFFCGLEWLSAALRRAPTWAFGSAFRVGAACVLLLFAVEHAQYIRMLRNGPTPPWLVAHEEVQATIEWMRQHLTREGPVATSNPPLVYLATGRKTLALTNTRLHWLELQSRGVPYGAALHQAELPSRSLDFPVLFQSPRLNLWVVEVPPGHERADRK
jgi:hypothetical protein